MMNSIPKLLPSWHDISLQDLVRQKGNMLFTPLKPPDYGGIGFDVDINAEVPRSVPKYSKSQIRFASDKCALPFIPLRNINNWTDPCLESLKKEKSEFDKFSMKLTYMRSKVTRKGFCTKLKTLQQEINNFNSGDQEKEVNIPAPKSVVNLADTTIPKRIVVPIFNVDYAGGTLAVCKSSGKQTFLHPNSADLKKLCITPLLDGTDQHFAPNFSEQVTINLKNEPILQIESAVDGFCVRQKNNFHLVNMTNMNTYSKTVHKSALYHIAANPYNPMEILSVYEKGMMKLRNMITRKTMWSVSDDVYDDPYLLYPTWRCGFGSHPFSALCLNERKFYCFDFREKNAAAKAIFNIENSSFYVGEELVGLKQWNKNPFQHFLTSSHHLILCDERYPKTAVMYWNHCLKNPPLYLDCADFDSDVSIIVIGTQKSPQLASFLCSHQTDIQPVSLSPPLLLSSPSDCVDSLKLHCHYIDDKISSRISCPLTGVCIAPHNREIGFTVLHSTSLGDIFYQDFKQSSDAAERTYHVSTGCVLTPPEKILPHLNELISSCDSNEVLEDTEDVLTHIQINIDKILTPPNEISADCMFCRLCSAAEDKDLVLSETCPTCSLSSTESQHLSKALTNESVLIGPNSEESGSLDCDMDYLSKFDDKYSKRILSVWLESDSIRESQDTDAHNISLP